jgi:hypothetical protein
MTALFRSLILFVVVTSVVWIAVLWHWERTSRNMTVFDIALYLGALPLVAFGVLLGLGWAWRGAEPRRAAALAAAGRCGAFRVGKPPVGSRPARRRSATPPFSCSAPI